MTLQRTGRRYRDVATGKTIDVWFPRPGVACRRGCLAEKLGLIADDVVEVAIESLDAPPLSTEDAWLRLHLLSELAVKPNEINLEGLFGLLQDIAWTSAGPVLPAHVDELRARVGDEWHHLAVPSIDKFPRMTDDVVPAGVRIADADRVRLGAYLSPGTTVMHEGFVNFNAGTLGDECIVEAGLYVTAGTKVKLPDGSVVAARTLSGRPGLLFRRNSQSGAVEVLETNSVRWGGLNTTLHSND
ncbi:MAG: tetrahydrodipicolinate succinyltransferase [Burkholderiaceae bacterium]